MSTLSPPATPSPRRDKLANRLHRNVAVAAAGVLVYLLVTGIPLQFTAELRLGTQYVNIDQLLDWYGLQAPELVLRSGETVQVGQRLFHKERSVDVTSPLAGAVSLSDYVIVASRDEVLVFHKDPDSAPEKTHISASIKRIGQAQQRPYLDTSQGVLVADALMINWHPTEALPSSIQWAPVNLLTDTAAHPYRKRFRARMLSSERLLQDLHSGRFFGPIGVLVIDLASVLLLLLAGTGFALWLRYRQALPMG